MRGRAGEQKPFLSAVCIITPAIVLFSIYAVWAVGQSLLPEPATPREQAGLWYPEDKVFAMAWVTLGFWALALPGSVLLGYPMLRFLSYRGWDSYLAYGLGGLFCSLAYRPLLVLIFLAFGIRLPGEYLIPLWFDWILGCLMGLVARWAITWRWLQWNISKPS